MSITLQFSERRVVDSVFGGRLTISGHADSQEGLAAAMQEARAKADEWQKHVQHNAELMETRNKIKQITSFCMTNPAPQNAEAVVEYLLSCGVLPPEEIEPLRAQFYSAKAAYQSHQQSANTGGAGNVPHKPFWE